MNQSNHKLEGLGTLPADQPDRKSARRYIPADQAKTLLILQQSCLTVATRISHIIHHGPMSYPPVDRPAESTTARQLLAEDIVHLVLACKAVAVVKFIPYLPSRRLSRKLFNSYIQQMLKVNSITEEELQTYKRNNW